MNGGAPDAEWRRRLAAWPPPVVVFNKSHSGSRALAAFLAAQGIFMGAQLNASLDSLALLPLVEYLVETFYPDYTPLWAVTTWPGELDRRIAAFLDGHLAGHAPDRPWGWKLCECGYILPVIDALFPQARYIHLLRDGRDVAFSDHVAPERPFWRKIYFATDRITQARGLPLSNVAYAHRSHRYNALHWQASVAVGRAYGAMLRDRYIEIRYEDFCNDFPATARRLLGFLGRVPDAASLDAFAAGVSRAAIGKHRAAPRRYQREVRHLIEPSLAAFGYFDHAGKPDALTRLREWHARLAARLHAAPRQREAR